MSKSKKALQEVDAYVEKLERKIKRLERDKRKLQSENKTLKDAWEKTEAYLLAISSEKKIETIFDEIDHKTSLTKISKECPNCGNKKMRKTDYNGFTIEICEAKGCGYRNRIHARRPKKASKS